MNIPLASVYYSKTMSKTMAAPTEAYTLPWLNVAMVTISGCRCGAAWR
jgi:hypothetical protein